VRLWADGDRKAQFDVVSSDSHPGERPTAFVSYAQSSREWGGTVLEFTVALRTAGGVNAEVDLFHQADHQHWSTFGSSLIELSDFTLIAVDPAYKKRWLGREERGVGAGVAREAAAMRAIFDRDQKEFLRRIKVVLLPGAKEDDIPDDLLGYCERFRVESFDLNGMDGLLRSIYGKPLFLKPDLGDIPTLPPKGVAKLEGKVSDPGAEATSSTRRQNGEGEAASAVDARDAENLRDQLLRVRAELGRKTPAGSTSARSTLLQQQTALEVSLDALAQVQSGRAIRPRRRRRRAPQRPVPPKPKEGRWVVRGVLAGVAVIGAGLVLTLSVMARDSSPRRHVTTARASGIELQGPPGWRLQAGRAGIQGLGISAPVSLRPGAAADGDVGDLTVVAGVSRATGSKLLPAAYRKQLGEGTEKTAVELGALEAYRYRGLKTSTGEPLMLFVTPTSIGTAMLACRIPDGARSEAAAQLCSRIAATMRLTRGTAYRLGPSASLARAMRSQFMRLGERQDAALGAMKKAKGATAQGDAAAELADAFRDAARNLAAIRVTPESEGGRMAIVAALRRLRDAYARLAGAAYREDQAAYGAAKESVAVGERLVRRRLGDLHSLGYQVSALSSASSE